MKKWNMIIDVAECTNCNLCTLAAMDEYVGNEWPSYSAPMPKHGHKWINIMQKERGQTPMIDVAYVPTMCNHCDDAPCMKADKSGAIKKRQPGARPRYLRSPGYCSAKWQTCIGWKKFSASEKLSPDQIYHPHVPFSGE